MRMLRLSPRGDELLRRWEGGERIGDGRGAGALARRLVVAGLAHPVPPVDATSGLSVSVVIPVRDRPVGLADTLRALLDTDRGGTVADGITEIVVVDDASEDPTATAAVVESFSPARLVRRARQGGPAAARNDGWRQATGDVVAFVDADCTPRGAWLARLRGHLADDTVGAVAPRVRAEPSLPWHPDLMGTARAQWLTGALSGLGSEPRPTGWIDRYERLRSPLDLGSSPAEVRPRSTVSYVPTTTLVVRRAALADVDGFDETLTVGEDVDLTWRLVAAGWRVRYEPAAVVVHPSRTSGRQWALQRYHYGTSAAALADRHGAAVSPLDITGWGAGFWLSAVAGVPALAATVLGAATVTLRFKRGRHLPPASLLRLSLSSQLRAGAAAAEAVRRVWWPLVALGALRSRFVRRMALASIVPVAWEWLRWRPELGLLQWTGLRMADDAAYGTGVWVGVLRARRLTALLPRRPPTAGPGRRLGAARLGRPAPGTPTPPR
jgi:GT2 family glycosyltransferase